MIELEQTEFWTDPGTAKRRPGYDASIDPVALDRATMVLDLPGPDADVIDDPVSVSLEMSEPVESLLAELEMARIEDFEPVATPPADREARAATKPMGTDRRHKVMLTRAPATARFNMARFLTLTGSLDTVEEQGRWYELPARIFRASIALGVTRRITRDFLKDLRAPPRPATICRHPRPAGWLKL